MNVSPGGPTTSNCGREKHSGRLHVEQRVVTVPRRLRARGYGIQRCSIELDPLMRNRFKGVFVCDEHLQDVERYDFVSRELVVLSIDVVDGVMVRG